ncbi:DUF2357 domain-containing protein [Autumnicola psychrophila]|uniref:DUF2357 domain-containing protein n=1 Tax=Autumnicola psychrophila TaxID=3075592 RepID=A0ABU3DRV0_9FLAO|nr:DUF2357 domain-containing protein [Zunongwangia sp. F225]MDT0686438.1 DUF2357 domain-containing protein [Zunongwangia sp. F225]
MNGQEVHIPLDSIEEGLFLEIKSKGSNFVSKVKDAEQNGEASYQIKEGCFYHYQFSSPLYFFETHEIVEENPFHSNYGRLAPNTYVGTLEIPVKKKEIDDPVGKVRIEVQSKKTSYREDYRFMLESITEYCIDLLMQVNSPVTQNFEPDFSKGSETLYQKFTFIKSVIDTDEFNETVHRIITSPNTVWSKSSEEVDIRKIGRFKNHHVRQLLSGTQRSKLPANSPLSGKRISSLPTKLKSHLKVETVDTAENRFIKHALSNYLKLCTDIEAAVKPDTRIYKEVKKTIEQLEQHLHHTFFNEISRAQILKINSPILQKKEGYREVLKTWLMFDLAAKLIWEGGDDVYKGGKKDVATLYEYWLFFTLLDLLKDMFEIYPEDLEDLIKPTEDELSLQLVQGKRKAIRGVYQNGIRKLKMKFNFNRTFSGNQDHPNTGSWTKKMRPDYTLSIWPYNITEEKAEKEELIVHVHFDAKYKIDKLVEIIDKTNPDEETNVKITGSYKDVDLLKMHAYKDAIRRTAGAYVLYPGTDEPLERKGFRELLPGLGAFPVRPSKTNNGTADLKDFLIRVIEHFLNRASQRENLAYRIFDIHKNDPDEVKEPLPEAYGKNRSYIPDTINVLVGFYKDNNHLEWIRNKKYYNIRIDDRAGAIPLTAAELSANYLLLHTSKDKNSGKLFKIKGDGPKVFSKERMAKEEYPKESSYLIFEIDEVAASEFQGVKWDFRKLSKFKTGRGAGIPFSVTLTELMKVIVKEN